MDVCTKTHFFRAQSKLSFLVKWRDSRWQHWCTLAGPGEPWLAAASACGTAAHVNVVAVTRLPVTPETSSPRLLMLSPWILSEMSECRFNFAHLNYNYKHGALLAGKFKLSPGIQWINSVLRVTATLYRCQSELGPPVWYNVFRFPAPPVSWGTWLGTVHSVQHSILHFVHFVQCYAWQVCAAAIQCKTQIKNWSRGRLLGFT